MRTRILGVAMIGLGALALGACSDDANSPAGLETAPIETVLLDVVPPGGATDVDPNTPVMLQFDHAMGIGMAEYAEVREDGLDGTLVAGAWALSDDRTTLTFTPDQPLKPLTGYVIHLGGGMMDDHDRVLNFEAHGFEHGGEWCTGEQRGMGPGGAMGDMGTQHRHDEDWRHPNGTYGMFFTFTTAA